MTRGQAVAEVTRTGVATRLGRIGASLSILQPEPTLLQKATARLVRVLAVLAIGFCVGVVVLYGLLRHDWTDGLLSGIALAIAMLPEEFPMVLAIFLAIGSLRLARRNVLVRRAAAIETLGAVTVLCVDKTGTLTENRMRLSRLWQPEAGFGDVRGDGAAATLLQAAALASVPRPVDPMDKAVLAAFGEAGAPPAGELICTYPLTPSLLAFGQCWRLASGELVYAAKGAPEAIFRLAHLTERAEGVARAAVTELAGNLRAAFPHSVVSSEKWPQSIGGDVSRKNKWAFVWSDETPVSAFDRLKIGTMYKWVDLRRADVVRVPWKHLWRPLGYRSSDWHVLVTDQLTPYR